MSSSRKRLSLDYDVDVSINGDREKNHVTEFDMGFYQNLLQSGDYMENDMYDYMENDRVDDMHDNRENDIEDRRYSDGEDDSEDSDFWVDEDNIISEVEVDMRDFHMNIDNEAEFMEKRVRNNTDIEGDQEP
ncbi:hypothetical protein LXL04_005517 [Taraxacum kok-saghyz]